MSGTLGLIIRHLLPSTLGEEVLVGEVKELLTSDAGSLQKAFLYPISFQNCIAVIPEEGINTNVSYKSSQMWSLVLHGS